ncbi:Polycomb protein eed-A [Halotydeus destructor]|nr:Polycomb protein eed-A [Halotydeus destructor]
MNNVDLADNELLNGHGDSNDNHRHVNGLEENVDEDSCGGSSVATTETENSQSSSKKTGKKRKSNGFGKRLAKKSAPNSRPKSQYKFACYVKEHDNQPIFGVAFNPHLQESGRYVFATASSNRISIYECLKDGTMKLLQVYSDPDPEESFYCIAWTYDDVKLTPLLAAGGGRGIIRVISPPTNRCIKSIKGHGHAVNDLKVHPHDHNLLLSVSKDHSLRLWNVKTGTCVAIFGGVEGHRDEVLSADFHVSGSRVVSCGMDHSLKIWILDVSEVQDAIKESYAYNPIKADKPFKTARCQIPSFTTRDIHRNYVDCVRWYGNFVMSKSCENTITLWKPGKLDDERDISLPTARYSSDIGNNTTVIHQFQLEDNDIWFMRFSMSQRQTVMALGNMKGKTYVWDLNEDISQSPNYPPLSHPKCNAALRQTSLSNDGSILICVSDDSTIWRWDRKQKALPEPGVSGSPHSVN